MTESNFKEEIEVLRFKELVKKFPGETEQWIDKMWGNSYVKYTKGASASAIEKNIISYIKSSGFQAEKRAVTGREIQGKDVHTQMGTIRGKKVFIPSTGTKGSADISAVVYGISIFIEVKKGNDIQSPNQKKYEKSINDAGGFYFITKDEDDFIIKFNELLTHPKIKAMQKYDHKEKPIEFTIKSGQKCRLSGVFKENGIWMASIYIEEKQEYINVKHELISKYL